MLMKPKIDYGSEVYSSASRSLLDSLEPIQNAALRIATGAFRTSPIPSLRVESGIKSLALFRQIKAMNYLTRIYVNPSHPLHEVVTEEDPEMNILVPTSNRRFLE